MGIVSNTKILLISTVHPPNDPRIVGKIANSLSAHYEVETYIPKQSYKYLLWRILLLHPFVFLKFLRIRPQVVYVFVPELLPLAFIFKWLGSKVVYEVQENLYKKIPTKKYNKGWLFEAMFRYFDQKARQHFYFVFTESAYLNEYKNLKYPFAVVHNFAKSEWTKIELSVSVSSPEFVYAGVISVERAYETMLRAIQILMPKYPNIKLHLFGRVNGSLETNKHTDNILFYGYCPQEQVFETAKRCVAGLALLKPVGDYTDSYPSKIFDYMALGIPVITSNFNLLKDVIEANDAGFCIDPDDAETLAETIDYLIQNPNKSLELGKNGQMAMLEKYNWKNELHKLTVLLNNIT